MFWGLSPNDLEVAMRKCIIAIEYGLSLLLFAMVCYRLIQLTLSIRIGESMAALMTDINDEVLESGRIENAVKLIDPLTFAADTRGDRIIYRYVYRDNTISPLPFWAGAISFECDTNDVPLSCTQKAYFLLPTRP